MIILRHNFSKVDHSMFIVLNISYISANQKVNPKVELIFTSGSWATEKILQHIPRFLVVIHNSMI